MHEELDLTIKVEFPYRLHSTHQAFDPSNADLLRVLDHRDSGTKALVLIEETMTTVLPELTNQIAAWFRIQCPHVTFAGTCAIPGGEVAKASTAVLDQALSHLVRTGIDRHSYLIAIGGGAFLDAVGLAAALAHRGVRLVRMPTTTLSQGDSGVGVKNGINFGEQKNYLGTFAVPWATVNDSFFLETLPPHLVREGLTEAIKVAIVQDSAFFEMMEHHLDELTALEKPLIRAIVSSSAILHAKHIAQSGDAFEQGTSRPLDFGHWSAHYLESMSGYTISHGQAVSIGICLDLFYSVKKGWLPPSQASRIIRVLHSIKMPLSHPLMGRKTGSGDRFELLNGLDTFQEHLGGELTILMLKGIGCGEDVHEIDRELMSDCIRESVSADIHPLLQS